MSNLSGRCACGAVRWSSDATMLWAAHCHCESCRRATGAPFTSYFGLPAEAVKWTGTLAAFESSEGSVARHFCATCGTHMSYASTRWPEEVHLYAASLDDPSAYRPTAHVYFGARLPWVELDDGLPKYTDTAGSPEITP